MIGQTACLIEGCQATATVAAGAGLVGGFATLPNEELLNNGWHCFAVRIPYVFWTFWRIGGPSTMAGRVCLPVHSTRDSRVGL